MVKINIMTPVAGSIFGPLSQTHISKSDFKNEISRGHVSAFSYMVRQTNNSGFVSISYMVRQAKSRKTLCLGTQDKQTVT